jgi:sporulation protein YlmC with PRC-barrel domain
MSIRLSRLYGLDIYTEKAEYVGKVEDVVLNIDTGEVMRLSLKSFRANTLPPEEIKRIIQEESIGYNDVRSLSDVIICAKNPKKEGRKTKNHAVEE